MVRITGTAIARNPTTNRLAIVNHSVYSTLENPSWPNQRASV
jgi:hypothetical protein